MNELCRCSKRHKSRRDAVGNALDNHFHVVTSSSAHLQGGAREGGERAQTTSEFQLVRGSKSGESAKPIFHLSVIGCCVGAGTALQLLAEPREMSEEQTVGLIRFLFRSAALPGVHFSLRSRPRTAFYSICAVLSLPVTSLAAARRYNSIREDCIAGESFKAGESEGEVTWL